MGANGSKGQGSIVASRQISRKTNKEDIFTVCTYNILADCAISDAAFPYCPKAALKQKKRLAVLCSELAQLSADVLCLQEVEPQCFAKLLAPELQRLGYQGEFLKKSNEQPIGVATFYKTSTFRLLKTHKVELNSLTQGMCGAEGMHAARSRLAYDNVALVLLLQLLPEKHSRQPCVTVTNTQLHWDRGQPDTQALEAALLLQELQAYAEQIDVWKGSVGKHDIQVAYIVAGDFNVLPKSPAYTLLSKGRLDEKQVKLLHKCAPVAGGRGVKSTAKPLVDWFPKQLTHNWHLLKSAYSTAGGEPPYTTYTDKFKGTTDYIWYSSDSLNANSALQVPDPAIIAPLVGLPNAAYPSHHVSLAAGFRIKKYEPGQGPFGEPAAAGEDGQPVKSAAEALQEAKDENEVTLPEYDPNKYDRYGYERDRSGIQESNDYLDYWKYSAKHSNSFR